MVGPGSVYPVARRRPQRPLFAHRVDTPVRSYMLSRTLLTRVVLTLLFLAVTLNGAPGQRLDDGEVEFDKKFRKTKDLRKDLFNGTIQADAKNKDHLEAIEMAAKEVTYPLYWRTQSARPKDGDVDKFVGSFEAYLSQLNKF